MKITLTGYSDGKKIHAIKALRSISGLGLKEAKDAIDSIDIGATPTVPIFPSMELVEAMRNLDELGVQYRVPDRLALLQERMHRAWVNRPRLRKPKVFGIGIPIYITRPNEEGLVASWSINAGVGLTILVLLQLNLLVWSCIGLYEAARVIL